MIEAGKRYLITRNAKAVVERFTALVTNVEDRGDFWYIGYTPERDKNGHKRCEWGYCKVKKYGKYNSVNYEFEEVQ